MLMKVLVLGLLIFSLCLSAEERNVRKVLPFPTKEKRDLATREAITRAGHQTKLRAAQPRLVGGKEVSSPNPYPWVALFIFGCDKYGYYLQGVSLIQSNISLTAAITSECPELMGFVAVGRDFDDPEQQLSDFSIVVHPEYDDENYRNDISLLFFPNDGFDTVGMFPHLPSSEVDVGVKVFAAGWGSTVPNGGDIPDILHQAPFHIQSKSNCLHEFGSALFYSPTQLCAGSNRKDTCNGDTGGPLFEKRISCCRYPNAILHGIISYGNPSCEGPFSVHTEVFKYIGWIKVQIFDQDYLDLTNVSPPGCEC